MLVTVDRIEEDIVVLELDDLSTICVDKKLFPNCHEKDIYEIVKNENEMKKREDQIKKLMNNLFE